MNRFTPYPDGTYDAAVPSERATITEEECLATHPGFTIICNKCQSKRVYFENGIGFSAESGTWGTADLVCADCGSGVELIDP